jgi:hypothetical protein
MLLQVSRWHLHHRASAPAQGARPAAASPHARNAVIVAIGGRGAAVLGLVADHPSIDFVYHLIAYLPLLGVVMVLLPNITRPAPIARAVPAR